MLGILHAGILGHLHPDQVAIVAGVLAGAAVAIGEAIKARKARKVTK